MNNVYMHAYARGYYYARLSGACPSLEDMPEEDQAYYPNQGFLEGVQAGINDFMEIDLVGNALAEPMDEQEKI